MSLLAVGSVAFDDLETPAGVREHLLGGSASYFSLSASRFNPVQVVAVVGEDFGAAEEAVFAGRPIDLSGLVRQSGLSFHWKGCYGQDMNEAKTLETHLNVFADFHPDLPQAFRKAPYLFLGNIDPRLQREVLDQMEARPRWVALDTMNFWIEGSLKPLLDVLKDVDILLINETESRLLTGERNLVKAGERIRILGPRIVVIKRGEHGALLLTEEGAYACPAMPLREVIDPTGAGDTFAGGFLGHLAAKGDLEFNTLKQAMVMGTLMASFTVGQFGVEGLQFLQDGQMAERLQSFSSMIHVDGL